MKRLIYTAAVMISAFAVQSQTGTDYSGYYQSGDWKNDEVLVRLYETVWEQVEQTLDFQNKLNEISAPFVNERNAKVQRIADSLGVNPNDAAVSGEHMKIYNPDADTVKLRIFFNLTEPINKSYSDLIWDAEKSIRQNFNTLMTQAFEDACKRYYENSERMNKAK
ncbi:MAG TPA: hypothetical protein VHP36_03135 [Chitinispirillaceae bacterium]|nr:hypothetical protein [Chitinispirillaceae bacterium]